MKDDRNYKKEFPGMHTVYRKSKRAMTYQELVEREESPRNKVTLPRVKWLERPDPDMTLQKSGSRV